MGGNVAFGDKAADRIDLTKVPRKDIVNSLTVSLLMVNDSFKKKTGFPLWHGDIRKYLSGSSDALFNLKIEDSLFQAVKPSVGDIDVQVNGLLDEQIGDFLSTLKGKKQGDLIMIDVKKSTDQYITLWTSIKYNINIQVDFELVEFDEKGNPTPWSRFSRSSAWNDMAAGIKGVAHKYVFRALTALSLHDVIIRPKTSRGKEKEMKSSVDAFSPKGYRVKLKPVLDPKTNEQVYKQGVPVYDQLDAGETGVITDLEVIFTAFFKRKPTKAELGEQGMGSYLGVLKLIKKYVPQNEMIRVADGMAHLLWGASAQNMYRNDNDRDLKEKTVMMMHMAEATGQDLNRWDHLINGYYKR